uniref:C-type lectin domain-containing protein n=1 Tax=Macrostomum lignano TaxID=282301 RepID=A0A1I8FUL8_9PLAT
MLRYLCSSRPGGDAKFYNLSTLDKSLGIGDASFTRFNWIGFGIRYLWYRRAVANSRSGAPVAANYAMTADGAAQPLPTQPAGSYGLGAYSPGIGANEPGAVSMEPKPPAYNRMPSDPPPAYDKKPRICRCPDRLANHQERHTRSQILKVTNFYTSTVGCRHLIVGSGSWFEARLVSDAPPSMESSVLLSVAPIFSGDCPYGWRSSGSVCYGNPAKNDLVTFDQAFELCRMLQANLAIDFTSTGTLEALVADSRPYWVGVMEYSSKSTKLYFLNGESFYMPLSKVSKSSSYCSWSSSCECVFYRKRLSFIEPATPLCPAVLRSKKSANRPTSGRLFFVFGLVVAGSAIGFRVFLSNARRSNEWSAGVRCPLSACRPSQSIRRAASGLVSDAGYFATTSAFGLVARCSRRSSSLLPELRAATAAGAGASAASRTATSTTPATSLTRRLLVTLNRATTRKSSIFTGRVPVATGNGAQHRCHGDCRPLPELSTAENLLSHISPADCQCHKRCSSFVHALNFSTTRSSTGFSVAIDSLQLHGSNSLTIRNATHSQILKVTNFYTSTVGCRHLIVGSGSWFEARLVSDAPPSMESSALLSVAPIFSGDC